MESPHQGDERTRKETKQNTQNKDQTLQLLTLNRIPLPFIELLTNGDPIEQQTVDLEGNLLLSSQVTLKDSRISFLPNTPTDGSRQERPNGGRQTNKTPNPSSP